MMTASQWILETMSELLSKKDNAKTMAERWLADNAINALMRLNAKRNVYST